MNAQTPKKQTLKYFVKNIYGNEKLYPANELALFITKIAGTTQLTDYTFSLCKEKYEMVEVFQRESEI